MSDTNKTLKLEFEYCPVVVFFIQTMWLKNTYGEKSMKERLQKKRNKREYKSTIEEYVFILKGNQNNSVFIYTFIPQVLCRFITLVVNFNIIQTLNVTVARLLQH